MCVYTHTCTHAHTHTHMHMCPHTHKHAHTHAHTCMHARTHLHACTCTRTHMPAHTHTYARTHARTRTHTHARMHTHTYLLLLQDQLTNIPDTQQVCTMHYYFQCTSSGRFSATRDHPTSVTSANSSFTATQIAPLLLQGLSLHQRAPCGRCGPSIIARNIWLICLSHFTPWPWR